eukprot:gene24570-30934_t
MNSVLFALFSLVSLVASQQIANKPLVPVDNLSLPSFLGRWFPMYGSQLAIDTSFQNAFCPVEDYWLSNGASLSSFQPSNLVAIDSMCSVRLDSVSGRLIQLEGILVNNLFKTTPGKFLVIVGGIVTQLVVLEVGDIEQSSSTPPITPLNKKKPPSGSGISSSNPNLRTDPIVPGASVDTSSQYPWAILSDSTGTMLFIVARDISTFSTKYEQIVLQKVQALGFTGQDVKPVKINQSADCQYPPVPVSM